MAKKARRKRTTHRDRDEYAALLLAMHERCNRAGLVFVEEMKEIVEDWLVTNDPEYNPDPESEEPE